MHALNATDSTGSRPAFVRPARREATHRIATVVAAILTMLLIATVPVAAVDDAGSQAATGRSPSHPPAILEDCRERYVIAPGVAAQVRPHVPEQFDLRYNSAGQPLLYITAIRCERYTASGVTRATTAAAFAASIESPDGTMCATRWPAVGMVRPDLAGSCNNYLFFAAYDNPAVVRWARAGTRDAPVYFVKDLAFDELLDPASLGARLRFASGATPSVYAMDLVVRERLVATPLSAAFWFLSNRRCVTKTVRVGFETDEIALGEANGQLRVAPGSAMAAMLGTDTPAAQQPFPLIAGNRWDHAELTKTVVAASRCCPRVAGRGQCRSTSPGTARSHHVSS